MIKGKIFLWNKVGGGFVLLFTFLICFTCNFLLLPFDCLAAGGIFANGPDDISYGQEFMVSVKASGAAFNVFQGKVSVEGDVEVVGFSVNNDGVSWMGGEPALGGDFTGYFLGETKTSFETVTLKLKLVENGQGKVLIENAKLLNAGKVVGTKNGSFVIREGSGEAVVEEEEVAENTDRGSDETVEKEEAVIEEDSDLEGKVKGESESKELKVPYDIEILKGDDFQVDVSKGTVKGFVVRGKAEADSKVNLFFDPSISERGIQISTDMDGEFEYLIDFWVDSGFYKLAAQSVKEDRESFLSEPILFELTLSDEGDVKSLVNVNSDKEGNNQSFAPRNKWFLFGIILVIGGGIAIYFFGFRKRKILKAKRRK